MIPAILLLMAFLIQLPAIFRFIASCFILQIDSYKFGEILGIIIYWVVYFLILTGIYLIATATYAFNNSIPGKYSNNLKTHPVIINRPFTIVIGMCICIFPLYHLFKQRVKVKE